MEDYTEEETVVNKLLTETTTSFEKLDEILYDVLPRDIVRLIYSFGTGICVECEKCCYMCRLYCSLGCLREDNRPVCCKWEYKNEMRKIENRKLEELQEEKEKELEKED